MMRWRGLPGTPHSDPGSEESVLRQADYHRVTAHGEDSYGILKGVSIIKIERVVMAYWPGLTVTRHGTPLRNRGVLRL
ncbi:hypothetical protein AA106556_1982 [Neokomagataea tanensis NBRC 106556]|uniref:Uncharacterized protein n=1 Tax=Neokomagataea tanensis NBRC 106556 TaxID=1223519 RepID=A0ABQ0QLF5_9PROT|nr:hypothetical protein AA106556_1982 [Neokomagataea tanensis NBRC 106556]